MAKEYYWNSGDWLTESSSCLTERKQEWSYIQHNLKAFSSTEFCKGFMKHHKKLFFEGVIDEEKFESHGDSEFQFLLPLFILWYHPVLSTSIVDAVMRWGCSKFSHALTMSKCREFIWKVGMRAPKLHDDYGLFGGREEVIVRTFWGEPLVGAKFDQVKPEDNEAGSLRQGLLNTDTVSAAFWNGIMRRLTKGEKFKCAYGQYLFEHAMSVSDLVTGQIALEHIKTVASNVLYFDESPCADQTSESSIRIRDTMLRRYREHEFHPNVLAIWDDVKAGNKNFWE